MNDDKIFFKIIMLIFNSNNFHLWIEEFKDLALKIKIWEYINSYDKIEESREEVLSEISHFVVKQSDFASSVVVDDLITDQIDQSAQDLTQSRLAKYFHELTTQQQENYRASVKELDWPQDWISDMSNSPIRSNSRIGQKFLFDGSGRVLAIVRCSNPTREIVRNLRLDKIR
jgi:hypothetical protein